MKKHGFTLAEVLITLGIIGVVSALVMPTFVTSTQNAKTGPKLAKAVAMFEQANKAILLDEEADSLTGAGVVTARDAVTTYFTSNLRNHLKGAYAANNVYANEVETGGTYALSGFITPDGTAFVFQNGPTPSTGTNLAHLNQVSSKLMIDINGNAGPNRPARDRFYFYMMDDGSLQPYGGAQEAAANRWTAKCAKGSNPTGENRTFCTGHVLENGLKVEYK